PILVGDDLTRGAIGVGDGEQIADRHRISGKRLDEDSIAERVTHARRLVEIVEEICLPRLYGVGRELLAHQFRRVELGVQSKSVRTRNLDSRLKAAHLE